jgi:hypothetical protein
LSIATLIVACVGVVATIAAVIFAAQSARASRDAVRLPNIALPALAELIDEAQAKLDRLGSAMQQLVSSEANQDPGEPEAEGGRA